MQAANNYNGKIFFNPVPTEMMKPGTFFKVMRQFFQKHPGREPSGVIGPFSVDRATLQKPPTDALRVTWLGHSSLLIETAGKRFLTDPVWYNRVSPFKYLGPKRFFQNPLDIDQLPAIDFVLLSHDHYDHLDKKSILQLTGSKIPIITMLGVGKRLINWGVSKELVTELDWWQSTAVDKDFIVTAAPARHFSGRWLNDRFKTLWGSFAIKSATHNIFFGADSGYYDGFTTIAEKLGPFDIVMLEIGAYNELWESIHMGPENAVQAALDLKNPLLMPIHWGTFNLAMHTWTEPVERLIAEAGKKDVKLLLAAPGETRIVDKEPYNSRWWAKYLS
ncbi:MAG TPA: MBL fold metallo-hydrolase [Flavisolibacter sp.]|nr:MBL fold metallo-hydrolase [Flavisolibacter sp.]